MNEMLSREEEIRIMEAMSECQLMKQINEVSFAVNDLQLYLDTHPDCREGLRMMAGKLEQRRRLLGVYARKFGPLTLDSANLSDEDTWKWMQQPFPWQQKGGSR